MKRTSSRIGVQASNTYIHVQSRMVDEDIDKSFQVTGGGAGVRDYRIGIVTGRVNPPGCG